MKIMGYSDVIVRRHTDTDTLLTIEAVGGTRRQRSAGIAAQARLHPGFKRVSVTYSETYGFNTATYALYQRS